MATFKIEDLFDGNSDGTVTQSSHHKMQTGTVETVGRLRYRGYRSRSDTKELIRKALRQAGEPIKFLAVAEAVDRAASPFLRGILVEMINDGEVVETSDMHPNERLPRFWYSLP